MEPEPCIGGVQTKLEGDQCRLVVEDHRQLDLPQVLLTTEEFAKAVPAGLLGSASL